MRLYNTIMMAIVACAAVLLPYGTAAAAACGGNDMEPAAAESLRPGTTDPEDGAITLTDGTGREKNVSYLDAIRFEDFELIKDFSNTLPKDTQNVWLNMNIVLDSTRIRTQHTVSLTPVLVSADGKREMPFGTIIIDGRTRHKVFLRRDRLDGSQPQRDSAMAIIQRKNGKIQEYSYLSSVPYGSWMLGGKVEIRECVKGCADCGEGKSESVLARPVLPAFIPQWLTGRIEPAPEPVKRRSESRIARLQFKWDRYDILPSLQDNARELSTVTGSISLVQGKDYIKITGIYVAGFASPEGTWEYNIRLSRNRARSFSEYIAAHNGVVDSLMHVEWSGEDWNGFREQLAASDFSKKDAVIGIIDTYTEDRNECERRMMEILTRDEYVWLLKNIYPYLRHCTYRIEYDVKNFDLGEARKIIYERPQDLNLSEMYKVAGSYAPDSGEYAHAMDMAAKYYPDVPAVMNDRALEALETGDAEAAAAILSIVADWLPEDAGAAPGDMPGNGGTAAGGGPESRSSGLTAEQAELMNTFGVACARAGQYGTALKALDTAMQAGNGNARHNLQQLYGVIDQLD